MYTFEAAERIVDAEYKATKVLPRADHWDIYSDEEVIAALAGINISVHEAMIEVVRTHLQEAIEILRDSVFEMGMDRLDHDRYGDENLHEGYEC